MGKPQSSRLVRSGLSRSPRRRSPLTAWRIGLEPLEVRQLLAATPSLLLDIAPGSVGSNPSDFVDMGGTWLFTASDGTHGQELWKTDGTTAGTTLVKDIFPGTVSSGVDQLVEFGGQVFFSAKDESNVATLWKSDGTDAGTVIVKADIGGAGEITVVNESHFFFRNGSALWKSDGTETGTVLVKQFNINAPNLRFGSLINVNGTLFLTANDNFTNDYELWKSDGTEAGTVLVKDIRFGSSTSNMRYQTNVNGILYFSADDGSSAGRDLWKSDGTEAGTVLVKDTTPPLRYGPSNLVNMNGVLYFSAIDGLHHPNTHGRELWSSDGTEAGTRMVKDIFDGNPGYSSYPSSLTNVNGVLYFSAITYVNDRELWKSDGTEAGTVRVKDILPGNTASSAPTRLYNAAGRLFFLADDGTGTVDIWESDGTEAGTRMVGDLTSLGSSAIPANIVFRGYRNGHLYFRAVDATHSAELWVIEPTSKPALATIGNQAIGEGPWSFVVSATDENPLDTLTFSLGVGAPSGMSIAPGPGPRQATISWTPGDDVSISPNPHSITVIVTDNSSELLSDSQTIQLTVVNTPPTAGLSGPQVTRTGVSQTFTLLATDPAAWDQAAGFNFDVDWDGNGTFDESTSGLSGTTLNHAFAVAGSYNVGVRATDKETGTSSVFTLPVHVWHLSPVGADVVWEGSGGEDIVEFEQTGAGAVEVRTLQIGGFATNVVESFPGVTGRIIGKGNAGNDILNATSLLDIPATLEGGRHNDTIIGGAAGDILRGEFVGAAGDGAEGNDSIIGGGGNDLIDADGLEGGNDTIRGGAGNDTILGDGGDGLEGRSDTIYGGDGDDQIFGHHGNDLIDGGNDNDLITGGDGAEANDILVGGQGNDSLSGGAGKDLLIGGVGLDTLRGEAGEDLLLADQTSVDMNAAALLALHAEWTSDSSYADRVAHLTGTAGGLNSGVYLQPGTTVYDDEAVDNLTGGATELDWFVYNLLEDVLNDHAAAETETDTDGFMLP